MTTYERVLHVDVTSKSPKIKKIISELLSNSSLTFLQFTTTSSVGQLQADFAIYSGQNT